ncbi:PP2C family protein-serine/threonine phosphatase [Candidatus Viridilinea mediisalina]|uniref:Stage II sporulation protein E n=1 Tax=Candidatus Viridilinea mediisalina TaxID=2024553 RepID=A0A2A6RHH8_9CHLR|nr:PP2C family protein-serine/threonine phosphatase [Candidatus Viridilinea mediisalina]PDW02328.1 stage II sporulation protein E [Candidatus Viridilinea mediisalina]
MYPLPKPKHKSTQPRCGSLLSHEAGVTLRRPRKRVVAPVPTLTPEQQRRNAEIEQELQLARDLQQGLLLEAAPRLPGWELAAVSLPARDLGGDLYDFLDLGAGIQGIMIGDVSGKGLSAALRMAVARTVFRHEARRADQPGPTLAEVNRGVLREIPQGMVTMFYLCLDTKQGLLRMANAGHTFPLFINSTVTEVELSGLPLGVDGDSDYEEATASVQPGETLFLYTDGVLEAENTEGEIYTYERLQALIEANVHLKPRAIVSLLLRELRTWSEGSQNDDVTMVILRRRLTNLDAELRSVASDVLGFERANTFWVEHVTLNPNADAHAWIAALPDLLKIAQTRFGRGLARELNQQLRLALEDYR